MDTALPQKFPFILDRNLAKVNCTGNWFCTSCDIVVLGCSQYICKCVVVTIRHNYKTVVLKRFRKHNLTLEELVCGLLKRKVERSYL